MPGIMAAMIAAHVPTLGRAEITPDYQKTLVDAERRLGALVREKLKPDLWVLISAHWVATFDWVTTCQAVHDGICVADEAPNLIPGSPYRYQGDPEFAAALIEAFGKVNVPAARNDSEHYGWDYGTYVPLSHLDPGAQVAVVGLPSVLMADHAECLRAGVAVHETAKRLGRNVVFVASTALAHVLIRGRQNWPTPPRMEADKRFIEMMKRGAIDEAVTGLADYTKANGVEMGGRPLATFLGVAQAMQAEGRRLTAQQYGEYAQSSGSGNTVLLLSDSETLRRVQ